jgi:hypothetical protein
VKLLDSSPAGDASRLRIVHWSVARLSCRTKEPDFEFVFAELRTPCWNLLYGFVRHLVYRLAYNDDVVAFKMGRRQGASEGELGQ